MDCLLRDEIIILRVLRGKLFFRGRRETRWNFAAREDACRCACASCCSLIGVRATHRLSALDISGASEFDGGRVGRNRTL